METRMESVGSGLPNAYPERTRITDGWLVVDEGERPVGQIRFFWVPVNKARLAIAGRFVDMEGLEPGALIQITAGRMFLLSWLWHSLLLPT